MSTLDKSVLFVVGMHRSGTSAFTHVLSALGIELGHNLIDAGFDNPEGFFEHKQLVQLNNAIFEILGLHWDATVPLPEGWLQHNDINLLKTQAVEWLCGEEFTAAPLIALKGPRLCRTLPFWLAVAQRVGRRAVAVHLFRNLNEIAHSFAAREQTDHRKAVILSILYLAEALQATATLPRVALHYEDLFADLPGCLETLYRLPVPWPMLRAEAEQKASQVIKPQLRNNTAPDISAWLDPFLNSQQEVLNAALKTRSFFNTPALAQQLQASYQALQEKISLAEETFGFWHHDAMQAHSFAVHLHEARLREREQQSILENYKLHAKQLEDALHEQSAQLMQKESDLMRKASELAQIYNSRSWKFLRCLCGIKQWVKKKAT